MSIDVLRELLEADPFLKALGVKVESIAPGDCVLRLDFREELTRFGGIMNGGAIATLMDAAGGCAALAYNLGRNEVTVDLSISYMKPVAEGPVRARANLVRGGKALAFVEMKLEDGRGELCAAAKGTYMYLDWP
ncbi:MAG: PaaI family thioesterase [Nitrososphaeria archaeon]